MRILLVEDDSKTATYVARGLRESGQSVEVSADGRDGLFRMTNEEFDLAIVDRMLPEIDGLSVVRAARAAGFASQVLFLTEMDSIQDRVAGLRGGADDSLVKPFSFDELNARVQALGRRPPLKEEDTLLVVGDL